MIRFTQKIIKHPTAQPFRRINNSLSKYKQQANNNKNQNANTRSLTTSKSQSTPAPAPPQPQTQNLQNIKNAKTRAGTGMSDAEEASMSMIPRGPVSWSSLGLVTVVAVGLVSYYQIERERRLEEAMGKIVSTGKPAIGGDWSLIDLEGNLVTNKSFEGKWTLLYFGFARCPDICPSEMVKIGKVMDTLLEEYPEVAKQVKPLFVSVDPARDSLKALGEYGKDFHPSYIFLTGSPTQVHDMSKKYRVYVSKADETEDGDYLIDHSIVVYFHDHNGDLVDCFTQSMRPGDIVDKILERMNVEPKK